MKKILISVVLTLLMGCSLTPVVDDRSIQEQADAAMANKEYGKALELMLAAEKETGDPKAQTSLGIMYERGFGTERDYAAAKAWYTKAANQDYGEAKYYLADMMAHGRGTDIDYMGASKLFLEAARWFKKRADEHKDKKAMMMLFHMYREGDGVMQDDKIAYQYLRATKEGDAPGYERPNHTKTPEEFYKKSQSKSD